MEQRRIFLTSSDRHRLYVMLAGLGHHLKLDAPYARDLEGEIESAQVVAPTEAAADLVTMRSTFRITDLETGEQHTYTLVYPEEADLASGRISVLAPLGTAVIGQRVGDTLEWRVPSGVRRLRIDEILYQPEAAGDYNL